MRTIHDYLILARHRHGFTSRRQLSNALGLNASTVLFWDQKRTLPNDDAMIALADRAGIDRLEALIDRDRWRAAGVAKTCYEKIGEVLARTAATALILLAFAMPAGAGTGRAQGNVAGVNLDIMANRLFLFLTRRLAGLVSV